MKYNWGVITGGRVSSARRFLSPSVRKVSVAVIPPSPPPVSETPLELPEDQAPPQTRGASCLGLIWEVVQTLILALVLYLGLNYLTARVQVHGQSMYPTFKGGEYVLVYRQAYHWGQPQRGDIVVFHPDSMRREDYIKRIIGLPGDTVRIHNGVVYINGQPIEEPYINEPPRYEGQWTVPEGYIFVLGDNRNNSRDSHVMGPVPLDTVVGKAILVYWPLESLGKIKTPDLTPSTTSTGSVR